MRTQVICLTTLVLTASLGTHAAPQATSAAQPDLAAAKVEFVPGEKTILADDFSDMPADAPPPHWKVRGGTAELRTGGEVRQLTFTARRVELTPNLTALPQNFTMELDLKLTGHDSTIEWRFKNKLARDVMRLRFATVYNKLSVFCATGPETITSQYLPTDFTKPVKTALWLQNGRMRLYINGQRVFDVNQIQLPDLGAPVATIGVAPDPKTERSLGILYARFAESTPDFSQTILSSGRYVSHGILFDTDSARLKAESAPVIQMIARGLQSNPALKLRIEGHTDAAGAAAHNLDLSKRRAEAVKAVLVEQFQIDAARLTTAGLGSTKPVDSSGTPAAMAQNRRVELVKQ